MRTAFSNILRLVSVLVGLLLTFIPSGIGAETPTQTFIGHDHKVIFAALLSDNWSLVSVDDHHSIKVWDTRSGKEVARMHAADSRVTAVAAYISPDGKTLVVNSEVWDIPSRKLRFRLALGSTATRGFPGIGFSPDGKRLISVWNKAHAWDLATGEDLDPLDRSISDINGIVCSPDGEIVVMIKNRYQLIVWSVAKEKTLHSIDWFKEEFCFLAFTPDGQLMAVTDVGARMTRFIEPKTLRRRTPLPFSKSGAEPAFDAGILAFSPDGKLFAIGGYRTVCVFPFDAKEQWCVAEKPSAWLDVGKTLVKSMNFSPDSKRIVIAVGKKIIIWTPPHKP